MYPPQRFPNPRLPGHSGSVPLQKDKKATPTSAGWVPPSMRTEIAVAPFQHQNQRWISTATQCQAALTTSFQVTHSPAKSDSDVHDVRTESQPKQRRHAEDGGDEQDLAEETRRIRAEEEMKRGEAMGFTGPITSTPPSS